MNTEAMTEVMPAIQEKEARYGVEFCAARKQADGEAYQITKGIEAEAQCIALTSAAQ